MATELFVCTILNSSSPDGTNIQACYFKGIRQDYSQNMRLNLSSYLTLIFFNVIDTLSPRGGAIIFANKSAF